MNTSVAEVLDYTEELKNICIPYMKRTTTEKRSSYNRMNSSDKSPYYNSIVAKKVTTMFGSEQGFDVDITEKNGKERISWVDEGKTEATFSIKVRRDVHNKFGNFSFNDEDLDADQVVIYFHEKSKGYWYMIPSVLIKENIIEKGKYKQGNGYILINEDLLIENAVKSFEINL